MVAEAIPETPVESDSQPSQPDPSPTPPELSSEEAQPVEAASEAPEPRGEEPPKPVAQLSANEQEAELRSLDEKARDKGLSAEEYTRQNQLNQAISHRRDEQTRWLQNVEAENDRVFSEVQQVSNQTWQAVESAMRLVEDAVSEGREPKLEREVLGEKLRTWAATGNDIFHQTVLRELRKEALQRFGDTPENRSAVFGAKDTVQFVKAMLDAAHTQGRNTAPDDSHVVHTKAEYDKAIRDARKAGYDEGLAKSGGIASSTVNGKSGEVRTLPTPDQWNAGTYEDRQKWKQQHGNDVADRIFGFAS